MDEEQKKQQSQLDAPQQNTAKDLQKKDEGAPHAKIHIPGISDRASHLAMNHSHAPIVLRPPGFTKNTGVEATAPTSRLECEERCGNSGLCDPAHIAGCGGKYCGQNLNSSHLI